MQHLVHAEKADRFVLDVNVSAALGRGRLDDAQFENVVEDGDGGGGLQWEFGVRGACFHFGRGI